MPGTMCNCLFRKLFFLSDSKSHILQYTEYYHTSDAASLVFPSTHCHQSSPSYRWVKSSSAIRRPARPKAMPSNPMSTDSTSCSACLFQFLPFHLFYVGIHPCILLLYPANFINRNRNHYTDFVSFFKKILLFKMKS